MMPNMREALRGLTKRTGVQIIKQKLVDGEAVQQGQELERASIVMVPMPARKISIKPEGQRTWKWWDCTSTVKLELGWNLKDDRDPSRVFEVMELSDWSQAGVYAYELAENPQ